MYQLLLVEDDEKIVEVIKNFFDTKSDMDVTYQMQLLICKDGKTAYQTIVEDEENKIDLFLLDVMVPFMDGFTLCKAIRKRSTAPIIFLTARGIEQDILYGYDIGCDDYMVKPFRLSELYAKVCALLNRSKGLVGGKVLQAGDIQMRPHTMEVFVSGKEIELPPKEYVLLKILMEQKSTPITRDKLITQVWGYDFEGNERILDNHIKKLRKALGPCGGQIKTVIGIGYKIVEK